MASLAALVLFSGCTATIPPRWDLNSWEQEVHFYLRSGSETADPFLATEGSASAAQFKAAADLQSGVQLGPGHLNGAEPAPYAFTLRAAVAQPYFLNLSKPVVGTLFISSQGLAQGHDDISVRIQLFVGDALAGGAQRNFDPATGWPTWIPYNFNFRPEASEIPAGATVTVKVTRLAGFSDFLIGTGGDHASDVEIHYFPENPLSSGIYVDRNTIVSGVGSGPAAAFTANAEAWHDHGGQRNAGPGPVFLAPRSANAPTHPLAALLGVGTVPAAFLLSGRVRRRVPAVLVAVVVAGGALSGCLGASHANNHAPTVTDTAQPSSTLDTSYSNNTTLEKAGKGAIDGLIRDDVGLAVTKAHVALLGTTVFGATDKSGRFSFTEVAAGAYRFRADAEEFLPLEEAVRVEVGKVTHLNVTLARQAAAPNNGKAHTHDLWGPDTSKILVDADVMPASYEAGHDLDASGSYVCPGFGRCEGDATIDPGKTVPPGTTMVEVVVTGTASAGPATFGLRILTAGNRTPDQYFLNRSSGVPFHIPIFPNEADPGHQQFSTWDFTVFRGYYELYDGTAPPALAGGKVHIKVTAFKGVVPYEPAHQDFWQGRTQIDLFRDKECKSTNVSSGYPENAVCVYAVPKGGFVPPGTLEVRGTFRWVHPGGAPAGSSWSLVYKGSDMPGALGSWHAPTSSTAKTNAVDFVIKPKPSEPDQFYQTSSYWQFSPDDGNPPTPGLAAWGVNTGYSTSWFLTATVYRDPAYLDS